MAEVSRQEERTPLGLRLRRAALFVLFGLVLLIPKTLGLRRRRKLWNALRLVLAAGGVLLVAAAAAVPVPWLAALTGLLLVVLALVARPAPTSKSVDEQAQELGALVVLNGGHFQGANGKASATRLFVAPERVHCLDLAHRPLVEIPLSAIQSLCAQEEPEGWKLTLEWNGSLIEFHYDGFFAEHLARVAETTLRSQLRHELPLLKT